MIRVILGIVHMSVMLHVDTGKDRESKAQHEGAAVAQQSINHTVAVGSMVRCIVNYCPYKMQGQCIETKAAPAC